MAHSQFIVKRLIACCILAICACTGSLQAEDAFTRFCTKRVDANKVKTTFGLVVGDFILTNGYRNSWEGGGSELAFYQTDLGKWNSDEKAFLTFLIFTSVYLSDADIAGVAQMLGSDGRLVIAILNQVPNRELADIFGARDGSLSWKPRLTDYKQAIAHLNMRLKKGPKTPAK